MSLKYSHTILLVDDEVSITKALQRLFRKSKYKIHTAEGGAEALALLKEIDQPVSLIISDQRMPGMSGAEFLEQAKGLFPDAIRFLLTGYSDLDAVAAAVNKGEIHRYLTKPWNDSDLLLQVHQGLEQFELKIENRRLLALTQKQNKALSELNKNLERKVEERTREIVVKNRTLSRLNKELEAGLYNTVRSFAALSEMHVPMLAGHGRRVGRYSRDIARLLNLSKTESVNVEIAALLHDIGKLGLAPGLLEKQSTPSEKVQFKRHPEEGQGIVRFIHKLDQVGGLIRSHHERFDGQGYPDRLKGEEIPLGARIIAVADAVDNIVNMKRDIKPLIKKFLDDKGLNKDQLSEDELLQQAADHYLATHASALFDPNIVETYLAPKNNNPEHATEREVTLGQLTDGMVLTRSLYTSSGRFLLPHDTLLRNDHINKLKIVHGNDPIWDAIYIRSGS